MEPTRTSDSSVSLLNFKCLGSTTRSGPMPGSHWLVLGLLLLCLLPVGGCTPRVVVRAHPTNSDRGIRYYRPKPYLKVEPAEVALEKNQTTIVPGVVRISLVYLPDFSEEYSIDVRSGLGIANVGIKLENGWNLTEISQELDSQTDDNVKAVASLLSAVGDVVPTSSGLSDTPDVSFTVPARNVPIGLYESIIGRDSRGCKRLYGFRYVGFVPFSNCPLDMGGLQAACCNDPLSGLYGLSFINGQMVFLPLDELAATPAVDARSPQAKSGGAPSVGRTSALGQPVETSRWPFAQPQLNELEVQLRASLLDSFDGIGEVRAQVRGERVVVHVQVPAGVPPLPIRRAAEAWLQSAYGPATSFEIELLPGS